MRRIHGITTLRLLLAAGVAVVGTVLFTGPRREVPAAAEGPAKPGVASGGLDSNNPVVKRFHGKRLDLWSLQPISAPPVPEVSDTSWPRNEVDAFILSKLEKSHAVPSPEASPRVLIRRVYFDLTGLPPDAAAVEAFERDPSPQAWAKVVEGLLESREYAEHQARMWMDVVRYSDSNGFDYDEFRPHAWRFRDYVVGAFAKDKPYDEFVREQLAGDEMVGAAPRDAADQDRLTACGFLRIGPYDNSAVKFGEEERCRAQVMSDVVETTGSAFLGLNLSCCRCHDHKTDPLVQEDYYRLRAVFEPMQPDDSALLDLEPQYSRIRQDEKILTQMKSVIVELDAAVGARVQEAKLKKLPPEDQRLWTDARLRHDPANKLKLKNIKRAIKPEDDELAAAATPVEKAAKAKAMEEVNAWQEKRTPSHPVFAVKNTTEPVPETRVLKHGDFAEPGEVVAPGVLSVLDPRPLALPGRNPGFAGDAGPAVKDQANGRGRRSALADWLFSEGNPLTARVMVNRLWLSHFGKGLVATPNDFGFAGTPPTHPELLDWLAGRFRADGWSIKKMHRLILTSAAYRQGPATDPDGPGALADFCCQEPRRMEAESLRDSMLKVAGRLKSCEGGPPRWPELAPDVIGSSPGILVENPEKTRGWYPSPPEALEVRSLYLIQKRSLRVPFLEAFDLPESNQSCGARGVSTVAPQALTLMNGAFTAEMAGAFAGRLEKESGTAPGDHVRLAFQLALQRQPDAEELRTFTAFEARHSLPEVCRILFNLNEFAYID
ncbi:MAG: hypothetical protein JWL81_1735 [Verrucomicrobiales bacterium]|nr:hypothetical protein [Verrucomicrobiales bacterium]